MYKVLSTDLCAGNDVEPLTKLVSLALIQPDPVAFDCASFVMSMHVPLCRMHTVRSADGLDAAGLRVVSLILS